MGSITREHALEKLQIPAWADLDVSHDVASFLATDYQPADLDRFMQAPPLWYTDFPHRERLLGIGYAHIAF